MTYITNGSVRIEYSDGELIAMDLKTETAWLLEKESLKCGGAILHDESASEELYGALNKMRVVSAEVLNDNAMKLRCSSGGSEIEYIYSLLPGGFEARLIAGTCGGYETVSLPGSFTPKAGPKKILLPIMQGMLWDGSGENVRGICSSGSHHGFSMQMYGLLAKNCGLVCAADESVDSRWRYEKDPSGFRAFTLAVSSLGAMDYDRAVRFYFTEPTVTAIAKRYRRHVMEAGRFISWDEKLETRPRLDRLFGALMCYVGYQQDDVDYATQLKKLRGMGFERALVYPVRFNAYDVDFIMGGLPPIDIPDGEINKIKDLGYDAAPWSWLNEAIEGKNPEEFFKINSNGEKIFGWRIDDNRWYKVCSAEIERRAREAAAGAFKIMTWDHYDVVACASVGECYGTAHEAHRGRALSRREDLKILRDALLAGRGDGSRAVSSECFNDLFSLEYDLGSVKAWPQYGPWPFKPVPLTGLVYHDSIIHSWWEVHNYNSPYHNRAVGPGLYEYGGGRADLMSAADALYGCPPDVFPFGAQYGWTGRGAQTYTYRFRLEDECVRYALKKALPVAELHKRIGKLEMVGFEFLSDDYALQRTTFSDGTSVTANFSEMTFTDVPDIGTLTPRRWKCLRA